MVFTLCSIGTELTRDDRRKLYSNFGLLYVLNPQHSLSLCTHISNVSIMLWHDSFGNDRLILNRYPYGHEELAICEDIDQVCMIFLQDKAI